MGGPASDFVVALAIAKRKKQKKAHDIRYICSFCIVLIILDKSEIF
jgi:hypothetical protein